MNSSYIVMLWIEGTFWNAVVLKVKFLVKISNMPPFPANSLVQALRAQYHASLTIESPSTVPSSLQSAVSPSLQLRLTTAIPSPQPDHRARTQTTSLLQLTVTVGHPVEHVVWHPL
jgi:hypothetical protein